MKENFEEQIDRTLRRIGSANPVEGMEERILRRVVREGGKAQRLFSLTRLAFGMSVAMAGVVIVAGSVSHSRHILPVAPGLHLPAAVQPGVGAASAAHVAPQPVTSLPQDRPRSVRKMVNGRAVISSHARKPSGVAVPKALPQQP
ncbi:MAG TPA: hypothetical protein VFW25_13215 [Silvibacterium sp.]|nr:hypothetical protein [Silvibacterium sp.]